MNKRNTILLSFAVICIFLLAGSASATIFPVNEAVITVDDDGPADYNTIQAAVDAASSGDTIYVYNGRYHENIIISKSLTLLGQDEANVIIDGDRSGNCIKLSSSDVIVNGFTITNASDSGLYAIYSDLNVGNVTITDNTKSGINFNYGNTFTIRNSTIDGNGGGIIYAGSATGDAVVEDNIITNNIGSGVSISLAEGKSATVKNNKIDNNAGSYSDGISISIAGSGGLMTIENNPVTRSGRYGIYLQGGRTESIVADSSVESSGSYGLYAVSSDLNVENVTITENTKSGIHFNSGKAFTIRNSTIDGNGGGIIYAGSATGNAVVEDNIITNNIGSGVSISLAEEKSATLKNNKIDNNAGSSSDGIYCNIAGTGGMVTIENNAVTGSGRYGIYLQGGKTDLNVENVTIIDNTKSGIFFNYGKAFTIRNSTIDGNGGGIIYSGSATGDAVVEDNIITNNIGSGVSISLAEGKSATVKNNKIDNNAGSYSDGISISIAGSGGLMTIENNPVTRSGRYGIYLRNVKTGSTISDFNVQNSGSYGLYAVSSDLNVENVTITDNTNSGIYFTSGKAFTIRNSTIDGNGGGIIYAGSATGNAVVEDNIITNNIGSGVSISLAEEKSATVKNNKIDNNAGSSSDGIYCNIAGTGGMVTIENNAVTRSGRYGIYLHGVRTDLNVENVTITDNTKSGIYFNYGKAFTIRNSTIDGNGGGIIYSGSATGDAVVEDNIITNNIGSGVSISLAEGKSAIVANNKIDNNAGSYSDGISISIAGSGGLMTLENNPVTKSGRYGIYLRGVKTGSTVSDSSVESSGSYGLYAVSSDLNVENVTIIDNTKSGIFFNSGKAFTIRNSMIDGNGGGIIYGGGAATGNAVVEDNIITDNIGSGVLISLAEEKSATLKNNKIDNNVGSSSDGIYCKIAGTGGMVTIENNSVTNSGDDGIYLIRAKNSILVNNNISTNGYGIRLDSSLNNLIYHNNFKNNHKYNAYDNGESNSWDDGYPSGGNYWEDYNGEDVDNDGIGDTPYNISGTAGAQDQYPLMEPWNGIDPDPDITYPVINSVILNTTDPNTGDDILVTVNATDNVEVTAVTADDLPLSDNDGDDIWMGTIIAINGTHTVNISASDAAGNTVYDEMANYTATTLPASGTTLNLYTGWNLISLPLMPEDTSITSLLSPINGNYSIIWEYNASDTSDHWKKYDPGVPFGNDLINMEPGKGYWIMMTSDDTLPISGTVPESTDIDLRTGWNLVGFNSLDSKPIAEALSSINGNYSIVWAYNASDTTDHWKKYDPGVPFGNDLINVEPGRGYWIMMTSEGILKI